MRVCEKGPCPKCGQQPCVCEKKPSRVITVVKLADGKERTIEHMACTTFWHPDGTPMSAQQFIERELEMEKLSPLLKLKYHDSNINTRAVDIGPD